MKELDPVVQGQKVLPLVYDDVAMRRLVRRLRIGRLYGGYTTIDVIGCNMLCFYCYVDSSFLTGRGKLLDKEKAAGKVKPFTPEELVNAYATLVKDKKWPSRIQITAAEPFLTPDWLIEVVRLLKLTMEREKDLLWIDTNGVNIVKDHQELYNFAKWTVASDPKLKEDAIKAIEKFIKTYLVDL